MNSLLFSSASAVALAFTTCLPSVSADPVLTIADMKEVNFLDNSSFSDGAISSFNGWNLYPADTKLIAAIPSQSPDGGYAARFNSGAAVLALHSDRLPVTPNTAYTLSFEQKQENIHIGFDMGGGPMIRWFASEEPQPKVLFFKYLDGSFDWRTVSYSFVSPPDASTVQISLGKRGMPGEVFYRNIRFAQGTLRRTKEELSVQDYLTDSEAYLNFSKRLAIFHADKGGLNTPELEQERREIEEAARAGQAAVLAEAHERKLEITPALEQEIIWAEMLKGAQGFQVTPDSPFYEAWHALKTRLEEYQARWEKWARAENPRRIEQAMEEQYGAKRAYGIGISSSMLKVGSDQPYYGPITRNARLALARNEEENLQLTLIATGRDLKPVSISISPLTHAETGATLEGKIFRIDQLKTRSPQYDATRIGYWPDIVYPEDHVDRIPKGENHSFWVNVSTTAEHAAGRYTGTIQIKEGATVLEEIPLEVEVWNITLPRPGKFKVIGRFSPHQLQQYYGWKKMDQKTIAEWNRFIFRKRWNSTDPFATGLTPNREALKAALEEGMNAVSLINISQLLDQDRPSRTYEWPTPAVEEKITKALKTAAKQFTEAAGEDHNTELYVFGFDEQHDPSQYPLMRHVFELAKKTVPGIKTITTTTYSPLDPLLGSIDAWVPLLGSETPDLVARGEAGEERWFYIYGHPFHPYPNASLIDHPGVEGRISFWLASRLGYTGFLHWLMNGWFDNMKEETRWPEAPWNTLSKSRNGEGYFLYPGPDQTPVASVRFELIRDGIEDWELLQLLKDALAAAPEAPEASSPAHDQARAVLQKAEAATPSARDYLMNDEALLALRQEIAAALIQLQP